MVERLLLWLIGIEVGMFGDLFLEMIMGIGVVLLDRESLVFSLIVLDIELFNRNRWYMYMI